MRKINLVVLLLSLIVLNAYSISTAISTDPVDITDEIVNALKNGSSSELAKYFNANIELAILDKEDIYSKAQAEVIIKDFFTKNKPKGYTKSHQGGKEGSKFVIGNLTTSNGVYRVYFLIKDVKGKYFIHKLRFELPNDK